MAEFIELKIITPQEILFEGIVRQLYFETGKGQTGILIDHHPYISLTSEGVVSYQDMEGREHYLFASEGVLYCRRNKVELVLDAVSDGRKMNVPDLERELSGCRERIALAVKGELSPEELAENLKLEKVIQKKLLVASRSR